MDTLNGKKIHFELRSGRGGDRFAGKVISVNMEIQMIRVQVTWAVNGNPGVYWFSLDNIRHIREDEPGDISSTEENG
jgi:hypothetical protein